MNAAERYIASRYEEMVDADLDLGKIAAELARPGIPRLPFQVQHDLDSVYEFHGAVAAIEHQPAYLR